MSLGDAAFSQGDVMRRMAALEREVQQLRSARRLESATIGEGGLTIKGTGGVTLKNGGGLTVEDNGGIAVNDGGALTVGGGGGIAVRDGGDIRVTNGGDITVRGGGDITVRGGGDIRVTSGGHIVVQGYGDIRSANFDGDLASNDPGSKGWALGLNRFASLGAMTVPVDFHSDFKSGNNFSFGGTDGPTNDKVSVSIPVPSWADEAGVMVFNMISARNDSASSDLLNGKSFVDGIAGQAFSKGVAVGEIFDVSLGQAEHINVSGRSSFIIKSRVWSGGNFWPANGANNSALSILVVFRGAG